MLIHARYAFIRRTQGFAKLAMRTIHLVHPKKKVHFGGFRNAVPRSERCECGEPIACYECSERAVDCCDCQEEFDFDMTLTR